MQKWSQGRLSRIFTNLIRQNPSPNQRPESTIRVTQFIGDISDRTTVFAAAGLVAPTTPVASIFHLASMVSGECELHFDDALRVNLDGGRNLFEAARALATATGIRPRVVQFQVHAHRFRGN